MPKRRVKERRKRAHEFKRLVQMHGGRKGAPAVEQEERRQRPVRELEEVTE